MQYTDLLAKFIDLSTNNCLQFDETQRNIDWPINI